MAFSVNQINILGNLGRDAETTFTPSGAAVSKFSVATERSWKDKQTDEWKSETTWINCVVWQKEKLADKLKKGSKVYVSGRLSNRSYEDKDGKKVYVTEVIADDVILLADSSSAAAGSSGGRDDGDMPF